MEGRRMEPTSPLRADRIARIAWFFVGLGAVLRLIRYGTGQPLWGDEAYLAASLIDRDFRSLLAPLEYHQVAPPLFMAAELAMVRLAGFSEWTLRLVPLLCGLIALPLALVVGRLAVGRVAGLLATATLAVSFYPIRFATEVKPYASDLMVALALLALALAWHRNVGPRPVRWLWILAAAMPLALGLSFPSVFVAGGIAAWLVAIWVRRRCDDGLAIAAVGLSLAVSFAGLYWLAVRTGTAGAGDGTFAYWVGGFPPQGQPLRTLLWLLDVHTSHAFAYPLGGARGASVLTTLLVLTGAWWLWKWGDRQVLVLLGLPFGMGLLAAALGRYPYGGSTRTMQYLAPSIVLLAAAGLAWRIERRPTRSGQLRLSRVALGVLAAIGLTTTGMDVARPYKFREDAQSRAFAQRFWAEESRNAVVVCPRLDLGLRLGDPKQWDTGRSAVYLCHQATMLERRRQRQAPNWAAVADDRPMRCVLYNVGDDDSAAVTSWLAAMKRAGFELRQHRQRIGVRLHTVGGLDYEDRYDVYDFVPLAGEARSMALAAAAESGRVR
jgi:hypothetical protein